MQELDPIQELIERDGKVGGHSLGDLSRTPIPFEPSKPATFEQARWRSKPSSFGAPELKDATSILEEDVDTAAKELVRMVKEEGPKILNRPVGSKPIPRAEQHAEWRVSAHDINWWGQKLEKLLGAGRSPEQATLELLDFDEKMRQVK